MIMGQSQDHTRKQELINYWYGLYRMWLKSRPGQEIINR